MQVSWKGMVAAALLAASTLASQAADRTIIVLDASGSMWGQIAGKPKLEIARETLRAILPSIPADRELGLMAYGHREKGSCTDIELVVPPAAGTAAAISEAAGKMKFLGKTPLSDAVREAAVSLRYTEDKATVVLITDGIETCNADPCALGNELAQSGVDFTAHVVGFGLSEDEGRQVACLAENTGGKYIQAGDADTLADALAETVVAEAPSEPEPAPEPEPAIEFNFVPTVALAEDTDDLSRGGQTWNIFKAAPDGARGERVTTEYNDWKGNLEPGNYVVSVSLGRAETSQPVTIEDGKVADPHFILNAGTVVVRPRGAEGEPPRSGATVRYDYGDDHTTEYGENRVVLPAGEVKVTVTIGEGQVSETFRLEAGRTVERDIIVGIGHAEVSMSYVAGMKVESGSPTVRMQKAAKRIDGTRETLRTEYGTVTKFDLPAGDYLVSVEFQSARGEAPLSVKVGERTEVDVVLDAGVLAVTAAGAERVQVFKAAKDLQGNRVLVETDYDAELQTTLNAGEYVIEVRYPGDKPAAEKPASVKAGERTEISVP